MNKIVNAAQAAPAGIKRAGLIIATMAVTAVGALAQTTGGTTGGTGADYSTAIDGFNTYIVGTINNNLPAVLGVAGACLGLGLAIRLATRFVHSV
jgi:hypothetical protein